MIRYQILQMDGDSARFLGFAKDKVRQILSSMTGLNKTFTHTWIVDNIVIKAKCIGLASIAAKMSETADFNEDDQLVKLWLIGNNGQYFYSGVSSNPCACRTLSFLLTTLPPEPIAPPAPVNAASPNPPVPPPDPGPSIIYLNGEITETHPFDGTLQAWSYTYGGGGTLVKTYYDDPPDPARFIVVVSNGPVFGIGSLMAVDTATHSFIFANSVTDTVHPENDSSSSTFSPQPSTVDTSAHDAWAAANAAALATWNAQNAAYADALVTWAAAMATWQVAHDAWASAGSPYRSVILSDGTELARWTVNSTGHPAPVSTIWSGANHVDLEDGSSIFFAAPANVCRPVLPDTPPGGLTTQQQGDWVQARVTASNAERARVKTCSDNFISNLKAGAFDGMLSVVRTNHLVSAHVLMPTLMVVNVVDSQSGSGDDITFTKSVTLSFSYTDKNNNVVNEVLPIVGTKRVVITHCTNSAGLANQSTFTTTTYSSWLPVDATGSTGAPLDFTFIRDGIQGLCQVWNGIVITGGATFAATRDAFGRAFIPPVPISSDGRVFSYPQIYKDYRTNVARKYDKNQVGSHTSWLDSMFADGELIDVIPLSVFHSDLGDLGLFPQAADISVTAKLTSVFDRKFTYKYDYLTGSFSLVGYARVIKPTGEFDVVSLPYSAGINFIFKSHSTSWDDVNAAYVTQQKRLIANPQIPPAPPLTGAETLFQNANMAYARFLPQPIV